MQRRLEQTLSGVMRHRAQAPPAPPPSPAPAAAASAAPPRRAETGAGDVDALLSRTLSNLELGRTRTGCARPRAGSCACPARRRPGGSAAPAAPRRLRRRHLRQLRRLRRQPRLRRLAPPLQLSGARAAVPEGTGRCASGWETSISPSWPAAPPPPVREGHPPATAAPVRPAGPCTGCRLRRARPGPAARRCRSGRSRSLRHRRSPSRFRAPAPVGASVVVPAAMPADAAATQRIPVFREEAGHQPGERFGQYTLLDKIAAGGMAEVWKARMRGVEGFQKTVAIKKILPHMTDNSEFVGMFIDEAKLAAQLSHPNIVHIYDLGKIGRDYYIAMEYVEGKDLRSLLNAARRKGTSPAARPRPAHRRAARQRPRLRPPQARLRGHGDGPGPPRRLAPERAAHLRGGRQALRLRHRQGRLQGGPDADGRAQGQAPVHVPRAGLGPGRSTPAPTSSPWAPCSSRCSPASACSPATARCRCWRAVRQGQVRTPRQIDPSIPPGVDEIVARALAYDPQARFQSAGEMKQRLEAVLALPGAVARPHGPGRLPPPDRGARARRAARAGRARSRSGRARQLDAGARARSGRAGLRDALRAGAPCRDPETPRHSGLWRPCPRWSRKSRSRRRAARRAVPCSTRPSRRLVVIAILTFFFLNRGRDAGPAAPADPIRHGGHARSVRTAARRQP